MTAWIMLVCGCCMAALGVAAMNGWSRSDRQTRLGGWGQLLLGTGLAMDGVPRIAGWSYSINADVAAAGLVCVLLGCGLAIAGEIRRKRRRRING